MGCGGEGEGGSKGAPRPAPRSARPLNIGCFREAVSLHRGGGGGSCVAPGLEGSSPPGGRGSPRLRGGRGTAPLPPPVIPVPPSFIAPRPVFLPYPLPCNFTISTTIFQGIRCRAGFRSWLSAVHFQTTGGLLRNTSGAVVSGLLQGVFWGSPWGLMAATFVYTRSLLNSYLPKGGSLAQFS